MQWFREYRLLFVIYALALAGAAWEISQNIYLDEDAPTPEVQVDARLFTLQYSKVARRLYPDSPRSSYYKGIEALFDQPPRLKHARRHFETALDSGIKTDEQLLYYYAVTLVMLDADPQKIDDAIANWRWNHPRSANIDPRQIKKHKEPESKAR